MFCELLPIWRVQEEQRLLLLEYLGVSDKVFDGEACEQDNSPSDRKLAWSLRPITT
jgi:hypothetical protein